MLMQSSTVLSTVVGWLVEGKDAIPVSYTSSFVTLVQSGHFWLLPYVSARVQSEKPIPGLWNGW